MSVIWFCRGCPDHLVADMEAAGHTAVGPALEERAQAHGILAGGEPYDAAVLDSLILSFPFLSVHAISSDHSTGAA